MTCALVPPNPNEFTDTLRRPVAGQGMFSVGTFDIVKEVSLT